MRFTRLTRFLLPFAFLVLGGFSTGLALVVGYATVVPAVVFAVVTAVVATVLWTSAIGDDPTVVRGAIVSTSAFVVGAFVAVFPTKIALNVHDAVAYDESVLVLGNMDVRLAFLLLTGALLFVPLTAAFGAVAARFPSLAPPAVDAFDIPNVSVPGAGETRRQLGALAVVLCLVVGGAAVVQYTDPTTPDVGVGPAYAGPDAPPTKQVEQAQERTRSVSHRLDVMTRNRSANATPGRQWTVVHDLERDVIHQRLENFSYDEPLVSYTTEDMGWYWIGNETPPPSEMVVSSFFHDDGYLFEVPQSGPVRVVERNASSVAIRFDDPGHLDGIDRTPNQTTVVIDRSSGRIRSMTISWRTHDDEYVTTLRYSQYETASADLPARPAMPLEGHVYDLLYGPLNGKTPLHD